MVADGGGGVQRCSAGWRQTARPGQRQTEKGTAAARTARKRQLQPCNSSLGCLYMVADGGGGVQRCSAGWRRTARPGQRQTEKGTAAARTARKRQLQPCNSSLGCLYMVADGGGGVQRCSAGWRQTARPGQRQTEKGTAAARTARKRQLQPCNSSLGCLYMVADGGGGVQRCSAGWRQTARPGQRQTEKGTAAARTARKRQLQPCNSSLGCLYMVADGGGGVQRCSAGWRQTARSGQRQTEKGTAAARTARKRQLQPCNSSLGCLYMVADGGGGVQRCSAGWRRTARPGQRQTEKGTAAARTARKRQLQPCNSSLGCLYMVADGGGGVQRCSAGWRQTARPGQRQTEKGTAAARTARKRQPAALQQQPRLPIYGCRWGGRGAEVFGGLAADCQTRAATDRKGTAAARTARKRQLQPCNRSLQI